MPRVQNEVRRFAALLLIVLAGCRTGRYYPDETGPRYAGGPPRASASPVDTTHLKVVSFNVEFSIRVDNAIALLATDSVLRDAGIILLQEMNEKAARQVAAALGLYYVKIVLPHVSRFVRTQRTATSATIQVGSRRVRVYSTHLGTPTDIGAGARRDQLRAILDDAARYDRVIVGGDMNDAAVGRVARETGYAWPTEHGPPTSRLGRLDHIFVKGLSVRDSAGAGAVLAVRGISDHLPVWTVVDLRCLPSGSGTVRSGR